MSRTVQRRYYHDVLPYKRSSKPQVAAKQPVVVHAVPLAAPMQAMGRNIDGVVSSTRMQPAAPRTQQKPKQLVQGALIMDVVRHRHRQESKPLVSAKVPEQSKQLLAKQFEPDTKQSKHKSKKSRKKRKIWRMLPVGVSALVLIAGLGVFWLTLETNKQVAAQVATAGEVFAASTEDGAEPPAEDDVPESAVRSYSVSPDMPKTIEIKKLNVLSRVRRVGVLKNGELAVPGNINDSGWYEGSSKPGTGGAVLMVGHVHGPTKPGAFAQLKTLEKGDEITVTRGDGKEFTYRVVTKEQVAKDNLDMTSALLPVTPGRQGLNIITCGGKFLPATLEYADRVVIYAEQI